MGSNTYNSTANTSWTCPKSGSATVEVWGAGGGGGANNRTGNNAGGGGGGGAYSTSSVTVVKDTVYTIVIGAGGQGGALNTRSNGNNGGYSSFNNNEVSALGGANGQVGGTGGAGGTTGGVGSTKYAGGSGAGKVATGIGGGGGASWVSGTTCASGSGQTGGNNTGGANAASGGNGTASGAGTHGVIPGGGGGGGGNTTATQGGNGANGQVKISWDDAIYAPISDDNTASISESILGKLILFVALAEASAAYSDAMSGGAVGQIKPTIGESNTAYSESIQGKKPGWAESISYRLKALSSIAESNSAYSETITPRLLHRGAIAESNATYSESISSKSPKSTSIVESSASYAESHLIRMSERVIPAEANADYAESPLARMVYRGSVSESENNWDEKVDKTVSDALGGATPIDATPGPDDLNYWAESIAGRFKYLPSISESLNQWSESITSIGRTFITISETSNNWTEAQSVKLPIKPLISDASAAWTEGVLGLERIRPTIGESAHNWTEAISGRKSYRAGISETSDNWTEIVVGTAYDPSGGYTPINVSDVGDSLNFWSDSPGYLRLLRNSQTFTGVGSTQNWTTPSTATRLTVECFAGGGGGGACYSQNATGSGGGGGGGGFARKYYATPSGTYSLVVGSQGTSTTTTAGTKGGTSWFGSNNSSGCVADGGTGGGRGTSTAGGTRGDGGSVNYGDTTYAGGNGFNGVYNQVGGGGGEGSGGTAVGTSATGQAGATGTAGGDGGNGGNNHVSGNAAPAGQYGGGGGGAGHRNSVNLSGGSGTPGKIVLTWSEYPFLAFTYPLEDSISPSESVALIQACSINIGESNSSYSDFVNSSSIQFRAWRDSVSHSIVELSSGEIRKTPSDSNALYSDSAIIFERIFPSPSDSNIPLDHVTRQYGYISTRTKAWWDEVECNVITDISSTKISKPFGDSLAFWADRVSNPGPLLYRASDSIMGSISLAWDASTSSDVISYFISYDTHSSPDSNTINAGLVTSYTFTDLSPGRWYFTVRAYDSEGYYSVPSNEVSGYVVGYSDSASSRHRSVGVATDSMQLSELVSLEKRQISMLVPLEIDDIFESNASYQDWVDGTNGPLRIPISDSNIPNDSVLAVGLSPITVSETVPTYLESVNSPATNANAIVDAIPVPIEDIDYIRNTFYVVVPLSIQIPQEGMAWQDNVHNPLVPHSEIGQVEDNIAFLESVSALHTHKALITEDGNNSVDAVVYSGIYVQIGFILEEATSLEWAESVNGVPASIAITPGKKWVRNWKKQV